MPLICVTAVTLSALLDIAHIVTDLPNVKLHFKQPTGLKNLSNRPTEDGPHRHFTKKTSCRAEYHQHTLKNKWLPHVHLGDKLC